MNKLSIDIKEPFRIGYSFLNSNLDLGPYHGPCGEVGKVYSIPPPAELFHKMNSFPVMNTVLGALKTTYQEYLCKVKVWGDLTMPWSPQLVGTHRQILSVHSINNELIDFAFHRLSEVAYLWHTPENMYKNLKERNIKEAINLLHPTIDRKTLWSKISYSATRKFLTYLEPDVTSASNLVIASSAIQSSIDAQSYYYKSQGKNLGYCLEHNKRVNKQFEDTIKHILY